MAAEPLAIVGIGCRFPGADSPNALYANLIAGTNSVLAIPEERVLLKRHAVASDRHARIPDFGGFLSDVTAFDSALFRFSPREAEATCSMSRLGSAGGRRDFAGRPARHVRTGLRGRACH